MPVYYNELDPYAAEWLRRLIKAGELPAGDVDERDIRNLTPDDLKPYTQCHFFAGIGGWPLALRQAGWPEDRPVWTGSCPCQPFSISGRQKGFDDARHLWPVWFNLIKACKPASVFGEQVASKSALEWLDLVSDDLETAGYAVGAADLCAASVNAPHMRQRLWFGAYPKGLANAVGGQLQDQCKNANKSSKPQAAPHQPARTSHHDGLVGGKQIQAPSSQPGWHAVEWLCSQDGYWRPVEPGTHPLDDGVPNRVGRIRAYGNAIVPQVGAAFIKTFEQAMKDTEINT